MSKKILPQELLKLIACITMLIDHIAVVIVPNLSVPYMAELYNALRIIGRISFPIYCFLLAEGMHHTHNPGKYIGRLAVGILLAELPYDILFKNGINWGSQSIMVTLTLGAVMLWCMQKTEKRWLQPLWILPFCILAEHAKSSYGGWGIAMIAVFALFDQLSVQLIGLLLVNVLMDSADVPFFGLEVPIQLFTVFAVVPITAYSGKKLTHSKVLQWGFYLFYPLHLLALWLIRMAIR